MQKVIFRLSVFLAALFIGIGIIYFPNINRTSEFQEKAYDTEVVTARKIEPNTEQTLSVSDSYQISPCVGENKFKPIISHRFGRVSRGVLNGLVDCGELPEYPQVAVEKDVSGKVVLGVSADETGKVTNVSVIIGKHLLNVAAIKAAYQTRFCTTLLGGESMKIYGVLTYKFNRETGVTLPRNHPVNNSADNLSIR